MKPATEKNAPSFLEGGGEMGELIRTYDWAKTPVGSLDAWPVSLRTATGLLLTARFPMLLFWGSDLITFYNDAFRPSLGANGKHPSSLGQRGEESWAESWPTIGPMIHSIMAGADAVWFEDQKLPIYRNGKREYAYWTYSFSPVPNDEGGIGGLLVTCAETTKAVEAMNELERSRQQLLASFDQSPVAIAVISGEALTFQTANRFYGELIGRPPEELVGKPLLEAAPELKGQGFDSLLKEVMRTGVPFAAKEVPVAVRRNGQMDTIYIDHTYQPQREADGRITGVLVVVTEITGQVLARKHIEESEKKFRSLIEEAPVATCLFIGRDLQVEVANDMMLHAWGKDRTAIGKPLKEAVPELEGQPFLGILDEVFNTGKAYSDTAAAVQLEVDGILGTYYYNFTYKPLFDAEGKVYAIMDMAVDVTTQVLASKQLEESDLFARSIFDNSPVAKLVFTGENMRIGTANQNMLAMLGRDESIIGKPFMEVMPELIPTPLKDRLRHVYTTGETFVQPEEKLVLMKDGQPYTGYYQYIYKALRNTAGEIYGIICTASEITGQVEARKKVEEAEAVLAAAIELAELATWNIDFATRQITYSPRLQEWLGTKAGELEPEGSSRIHKRDGARIRAALSKAMEPGAGNFDEVYTIVNRQSGQERIIHANGKTLYDADGKPVSLSGTAQDVTIQKELQLALEQEVQSRTEELAAAVEELRATNEDLAESNAQLLRSNEELAQYAYVASHDLQEPLRKIRLFSSRLNPREQSPGEVQTILEKIQSSADRMSLLIKDLLEFSQLLKSDSLLRPVALAGVIKNVTSDFELTIAEKEAEIKAGELPVIEGVSLQLNQLFYNLIGNALKFTKPGRKAVIEVASRPATADETAEHLEKIIEGVRYHFITVSDNGIGFEPKYLEQIFEVFKRLHGRAEYDGSGIGLAICRRIVQNHQGKIYAEARPDEGATFRILLPEKQTEYRSAVPENFVWKE